MNAEELKALSSHILDRRWSLLSLWQEIADHFYPERADFTYQRYMGNEFAQHLMSSYPVQVRAELGNAFSTMLRPKKKQWFHVVTKDEERMEPIDAQRWLEMAGGTMRNAMYDNATNFVRTTREGDQDFATFGQCVIQVRMNRNHDGIIYRTHHLRDVGWRENAEGKIDTVARKWNPTVKELKEFFGEENLSEKTQELCRSGKPENLYKTVSTYHLMLPSEMFYDEGDKYKRFPYVSVYLEMGSGDPHIIEKVPQRRFEYVIPRWQTVSGFVYAYSPATIIGLPDARLMQAITLTLLEAGEKSSNPPLIATEEMVRSSIQTYAGGVTWVDAEYDENLGEVLRPISQDYRGLPMGVEMNDRTMNQLANTFYINKLSLPPAEHEMTAYETSQRIEEHIRSVLPLFEPMEQDYNGQLCEETFNLLMDNGAFGSPFDVPASLRDAETDWKFESPLHENIERVKGQRFLEAKQYLMEAVEVEPGARHHYDLEAAFRDALESIGIPPDWIRPKQQADKIIAAEREAQRNAQQLQATAAAAEATQMSAEAGKSVNEARRATTQ